MKNNTAAGIRHGLAGMSDLSGDTLSPDASVTKLVIGFTFYF